MNPEQRYARELRRRAGRHLPPDFPRQVLHDAHERMRRSQRNRWTAITAVLCVAIVLGVHWIGRTMTNRQNLEQWSKAAQQIAALEQTI